MKAMMKSVALGLLVAVAVFGSADTGHARPKKTIWRCDCTCIAYQNNVRYEGRNFSFDTNGQDCSIGFNVTCTVETSQGNLSGAYASCTGHTKEVRSISPGLVGGVLDASPNPPPPSRFPQLAPATATRR